MLTQSFVEDKRNHKKYKYMLKCDISWINHGRPLACSSPQPAAYSHHTFAACVLEFTHKLLRCWAFSEITTTAHVLCFPFNIWVHTRPWQQLSLTTPFKACWLKCQSVGVIDKQWCQQQLTVCPYFWARAATQLPKHAADGRWQRLVFCYCVRE